MKRTLEQRINRLERLLKNEACTSQKRESFESDLDDDEDDYYDEAKCRTCRSMNSESARKRGHRKCRRTGR